MSEPLPVRAPLDGIRILALELWGGEAVAIIGDVAIRDMPKTLFVWTSPV